MSHFWIRFWCTMKRGFYMTTTSGWRIKSSKTLPKAKLALKDVMVTVWWSAAHLIHYSFLSPSETSTFEKYAQQIDELHQKLPCLQPALVNRKGPVLLQNNVRLHVAQPMLQKLNKLGSNVGLIHHIHLISHQPTTTSSSTSTTFLQGRLPQPAGGRKCLPRVHWILKHGFLCFRNKRIHLSLAKMCSLK